MATDISRIEPARAPGALPLLGNALSLLRDPMGFMLRTRSLADIVRIRVGPQRVIVVNHPSLIHQILVLDAKKFDKGSIFEKAIPLLGNGLITSAGAFHLRQRRLVQPAFHINRFDHYIDIMNDVARAKAATWQAGQLLDIPREMHDVTLRTTARTLFSTTMAADAVEELNELLPQFLHRITQRALFPVSLLEKLPTPANRKFNAANARMRTLIYEVIDAYRRAGVDHGDFMSRLLFARYADTGEKMSDEQVYDEAITLMIAGTETTASMLGWTFYHLSQHPEVEQTLLTEIDSVLNGRPVRMGDLDRIDYTRRVLNEVMRLHSLVLITRRALIETDIGGRRYPAGTQFFISPHAIHHDPMIFPDPDRFEPDRWLSERTGEFRRGTFLPFGAGVRKCLGDNYAITQMSIVVASIAARWRLTLLPGEEVREVMRATVRPSQLHMRAVSRGGEAIALPRQ